MGRFACLFYWLGGINESKDNPAQQLREPRIYRAIERTFRWRFYRSAVVDPGASFRLGLAPGRRWSYKDGAKRGPPPLRCYPSVRVVGEMVDVGRSVSRGVITGIARSTRSEVSRVSLNFSEVALGVESPKPVPPAPVTRP